jgi:small subunit ribosomal protein S9
MADDEQQQNDEQQPDQPEGEAPADEQSPAEDQAPAEEEAPAEEALSEDAATEDDDARARDSATRNTEQESGEGEPAEEEPAAVEPAAEAPPTPAAEQRGKKEDVVPGAELDPIAIEPERELDAEERARREAEEEERLRRERELIGDVDEDVAPVAAQPPKLEGDASYAATGKRKSSVARVILQQGSGTIEVNKRALEEYFPRSYLQSVAKQPLTQTGYEGNVDVRVRVHGGGISGQAAAVRHGIARALTEVDPALRSELKRRGMLTRDARVKERRKAGLKKARKRPQFSKR